MATLVQDFYKQVISVAWAAGTGKRYVAVKPTPTQGILVISPSSESLREIIRYTSTGTDGGGDYIMVSARGLSGTTDQTHEVQEPIRMNVTGEHIDDIYAAMDAIVAAGAMDASTIQKGISTLSVAPASPTAPIAVGDNDPRVPTTVEKARIPSVDVTAALAGSAGLPSGTNKFLTQDSEFTSLYDQSQTTQDASSTLGEADATTRRNKLGQAFAAARTLIRGVELNKQADTGTFTGTVTITLEADTAGSPSGTPLATVTISNAAWLALTTGAFQVAFATPYVMVAGTTYWLVAACSTADNSNHPNLGTNSAGGYASGSLKYRNTTDGWVATTTDLYFRTLVTTAGQIVMVDSTSGLIPSIVLPYALVDIATSDAAAITGTTETTVYTKKLDAGFFTLNSGIKVSTQFAWTTGTADLTMRIKLNGTTVITVSLGTGSTQNKGMKNEAYILNVASLAVQKYLSNLVLINNTTGVGAISQADGSAAVDTSGPVTLTVTLQFNNTNDSPSVTFPAILVEKIG